MAKMTYKNLMSQINKLQMQAETVRKQETSSVIAKIKKQMGQFGLTLKDLASSAEGTIARNSTRKHKFSPRRKPVPKYKNPVTGATWTGRGKTPVWLRDVLKTGKNMQQFVV